MVVAGDLEIDRDRQIEVTARDLQVISVQHEPQAGQDGQRSSARHRSARSGKALDEVVSFTAEFHVRCLFLPSM